MLHPDRHEELRREQELLRKADCDIDEGAQRIRDQESRVMELQVRGHDTSQAERLVGLLKETLEQWERHRVLIAQRVAYLQDQTGDTPRGTG